MTSRDSTSSRYRHRPEVLAGAPTPAVYACRWAEKRVGRKSHIAVLSGVSPEDYRQLAGWIRSERFGAHFSGLCAHRACRISFFHCVYLAPRSTPACL